MPLTGVHFLLSYQYTHECDHCFVWASPRAGGPADLVRVFDLHTMRVDMWMPATSATRRGARCASGSPNTWVRRTFTVPRKRGEGGRDERSRMCDLLDQGETR
jgi:hypothetical protein